MRAHRTSFPRDALRGRALAVAAALLAALALPAAPAAAAPAPKVVVDSAGGLPDAGRPGLWTGAVERDGPRIAGIPECEAVSCERVKVKVKLAHDVWRERSGGLLVAIRFTDPTPDDSLALVVYRDGVRIAASTAQVATAQAVVIPRAGNGVYDVYVVDAVAYGNSEPSPRIAYEGLAQAVYDPARLPLRQLLPDLVALPQQNVTFGPPFEIFDDPVPEGSSCHLSEIEESGARVCLRFDQLLANTGTGPLDVRFEQPAGIAPVDDQQVPVRQRIQRSDGGHDDVSTGSVLWHAIHGHYHLDGFAQSRLWAVDAGGARAGAAPVATGAKVSFCIATTSIHPAFWGARAFGPSAYPAPDCLEPDSTSDGLDHFKQGLSVGWADAYDWFLPGQYVEVGDVPDGDYILDTTVDPGGRLVESDRTNNCGAVRVRLSDMGTPEPAAELLGPGPPCGP